MIDRPVVVVPIHDAVDDVSRCIEALRSDGEEGARVILIDDASTDPRISDLLDACPAHWDVHRQARNLGFVGTANRGMALAGDRDVVLLNSDAIVTPGWLGRLAACAESDRRIASVTPWSNNAEIASLPDFCRAAPVPEHPERWAAACAAVEPEYPEIPTAVGFCMLLRRRCIDEIGGFDEQRFGRGYGEENDWCMRARDRGWKHVLCDDAFVAHRGNASFGPLGLAPGPESMQRLLAAHPGYLELVRDFIDADPLAPLRSRILDGLE